MAIGTGDRAPEFDLEEAYDRPRLRLADFRGKSNVLLVFHPWAFTPVCAEEALDLQANLESFRQRRDGGGVRLLRFVRHPPGVEAGARSDLPVRLRLLAARCGRPRLRRLRRGDGGARYAGTFLIDKDGLVIWSLVKDGQAHGDGAGVARRPRRLVVSRSAAAAHSTSRAGAIPPHPASSASTVSRGTASARAASPRAGSPGYHVVAPDLLGHGSSPWEPPWSIAEHVGLLVGDARHVSRPPGSGIRSVAGSRSRPPPGTRAPWSASCSSIPRILIDPAIALMVAENDRKDRSYASFEEGLDRRFDREHARTTRLGRRGQRTSGGSSWRTRTAGGATATARQPCRGIR